jgi:hypothetical protein
MKPALFIILFLAASLSSLCQVRIDTLKYRSSVACPVDPAYPHFPGGSDEMMKFIDANMHLPDSVFRALENKRIFLEITVDTTGTLTGVSVLHGINKTMDDEMVRVFSMMPRWIPGIIDGKKVARKFVLPVKFMSVATDR